MFFDAVFDQGGLLLFNGTPAETKQWLEVNDDSTGLYVIPGASLRPLNVSTYLHLVDTYYQTPEVADSRPSGQ